MRRRGAVAAEIARHIPRLASKRGLDPTLAVRSAPGHADRLAGRKQYDDHREEAEKHIADRDPDDLPTVALALKLDLPVWTQDKDHTDAGIEVFTTGDLLDALRDAGHDPDLALLAQELARAAFSSAAALGLSDAPARPAPPRKPSSRAT